MDYTQARSFSPITTGPNAGKWRSEQTYKFGMEYDKSGAEITIEKGDISNGADVPPPWSIFFLTLVLCALFSWLIYRLNISTLFLLSASVALTTAWLLPRVHAEYIEAVFVHDIGLEKHRHLSRAVIDKMFFRALVVTTKERLNVYVGKGLWRKLRPYVLYSGVAVFGLIKEGSGYFKPKFPEFEPDEK